MSTTNGGESTAAVLARARETIMMRPREDVSMLYEGERLELFAASSRLDAEHPLVAERPELFERAAPADPGRRTGERSAGSRRQPTGGMSLEDELRVRRARVEALDAQERDRAIAPDATEIFWEGVARLLSDPLREAEDRQAMEQLDKLRGAHARSLAEERHELAAWIDEP